MKKTNLIKYTEKKYGKEVDERFRQIKNTYPDHPERRKRLAMFEVYYKHHKDEIKDVIEVVKAFELPVDEVVMIYSVIGGLVRSIEKFIKKKRV